MAHRHALSGLVAAATAALVLPLGSASIALADTTPTLPPALSGLLDTGSLSGLGSSTAADAPRLASVDNFRDVAGTGAGYAGLAGLHVNKGLFYRSNVIVPSAEDTATLTSLNLSTVYDLRGDSEVATKQDVLPEGVDYVRIPILSGDITAMLGDLESPEEARGLMQQMNRDFVTGAVEQEGFAELLTSLATTDGPQVFHCTAGKDRTGWTSYLLLSIAGVDAQTIMDDYLLPTEYAKDSIAANLASLQRLFGDAATNMAPLVSVEASYLQAGIDQLTADYGTVDRYLTDGLGLSGETIAALRAKLLG